MPRTLRSYSADGSVDLTSGPSPPACLPESNWIKTLPGKGRFSHFRLYGPTQAYFDRSWVLSDIQWSNRRSKSPSRRTTCVIQRLVATSCERGISSPSRNRPNRSFPGN
jgi:hypothetical protein